MIDMKNARDFLNPQDRARLSEAEIFQLLQEAAQQYAEYRRLSDIADISKVKEVRHPRYSWDDPIGLAVTERESGGLV